MRWHLRRALRWRRVRGRPIERRLRHPRPPPNPRRGHLGRTAAAAPTGPHCCSAADAVPRTRGLPGGRQLVCGLQHRGRPPRSLQAPHRRCAAGGRRAGVHGHVLLCAGQRRHGLTARRVRGAGDVGNSALRGDKVADDLLRCGRLCAVGGRHTPALHGDGCQGVAADLCLELGVQLPEGVVGDGALWHVSSNVLKKAGLLFCGACFAPRVMKANSAHNDTRWKGISGDLYAHALYQQSLQ